MKNKITRLYEINRRRGLSLSERQSLLNLIFIEDIFYPTYQYNVYNKKHLIPLMINMKKSKYIHRDIILDSLRVLAKNWRLLT